MHVEIADIEAAATIRIDSDSVFGRSDGENDIPVADPKVSSRHARVFLQEGRWFIEDLGSSNGTFIKGKRIKEPVELTPGMRFSLCEHTFAVVSLEPLDEPTASLDAKDLIADEPTCLDRDAIPEVETTAVENSLLDPESTEPMTDAAGPTLDRVASEAAASPGDAGHRAEPERDGGPGVGPQGPGAKRRGKRRQSANWRETAQPALSTGQPLVRYLLKAIPGAFLYYLTAVPRLLFRPIATVRKTIRKQPFDAFGPRTLIAFAFPAFLLGILLSAVGSAVVAVVNGTFTLDVILVPLIQAAAAIVVAVIIGFTFHPALGWIVAILKGESDNISRTNLFVTLFTVVPLYFLAAGIEALVTIIPLPFVAALPPLLVLVASVILLYVAYVWFTEFAVNAWVPFLFLGLMGASAVTVGFSMVDTIQTGVARLRFGNSGVVAVQGPGSGPQTVADGIHARNARAQLEELRAKGGLTAEIEAALRERATAAATGVPSDVVEIDPESGSEKTTATVISSTAGGTPAKTTIESRYPEYQRRREAIEEAMAQDPTLIDGPGVKELYTRLTAETIRVRQAFKVKPPKRPTPEQQAEAKVKSLKRDSEIFKATVKIVDELYSVMFGEEPPG